MTRFVVPVVLVVVAAVAGSASAQTKTTVFRVGAGVFNDRSGPVAIADLLQYRPGGLVRIVLTDPSYPRPFQTAAAAASSPPSVVRLAPDVQIPQTFQNSASVDRQIRKTTLSITYTGARGHHLFRARDINAPPPSYASRPDPAYGVIREIESNGPQTTDSLQFTARGRMSSWFNGQLQYTLSRVYNDTNGIASFPSNDYDLTGEWAPADFDRRHRFLLLGRMPAGRIADLGVSLTLNSAGPYTETLAEDVFNNGRGRARPLGIGRNSLKGAGYAAVDLRASRDFKFGSGDDARVVTLGVDAFNMLNRVNYNTYVGTLSSPLFGQPVSARAARQRQLSARVKF